MEHPLLEFPSPNLRNPRRYPRRSLLDSRCLLQVDQLLHFGHSMNMLMIMEEELKKTTNPNKVCNALHKFLPPNCIPDGWRIDDFLGRGSYGNVFSTIGPNNSRGALKIMVNHYGADNEFEIMDSTDEDEAVLEQQNSNKFHEYGLSPKTMWMCSHDLNDDDMNPKTLYVIHMGRIDGLLEDYLKTHRDKTELENVVHSIMGLLLRMKSLDFTHGDFHIGNIGYVFLDDISPTPHIQIIDHGFVSTKKASPAIDIGQLLRVIVTQELSPTMNEYNRRIMNSFIRQQAKILFGLEFPISEEDIERKYIEDKKEFNKLT